MPNIPSIKIGNTTYDVKDQVARDHLVEVGTATPTPQTMHPDNRLYIKQPQQGHESDNEYTIPTMDEFNDLNSAIELSGINTEENIRPITSGSKNLANPKYVSSRTIQGLTFSVAKDGKITISGTALAQADIEIYNQAIISIPSNQYTFSISGTFSVSKNVKLFLSTGVAFPQYKESNTNKFVFDTFSGNYYGVMFRIPSGTVVDIEGYPQFEAGTDVTSYAPFRTADDEVAREKASNIESYLSTNIPRIDRSIGNLESKTRNFFNPVAIAEKVTPNGITYSVDENGLIKISGTSTAQTDINILNKEQITLPYNRYAFKFHGTFSSSDGLKYYFYNGSSYGTPVYTLQNGVYGFYSGNFAGFLIRIPSGRTVNIEAHLQIEEGKVYTDYIPPIVAKDSIARERQDEKTWLKMLNTHYIGDCVIMKLPSGKVIMVDTDHKDDLISGPGLTTALVEMGITRIDHLILSHFHQDHVAGIDTLASGGYLDEKTTAYLPSNFDGDAVTALEGNDTTATWYARVMYVLNQLQCTIVYPEDGDKVVVDNAEIEFFNCDHSAYWANLTSYNDCSICNYVTIGSTVIMFTGDIDHTAIHELEKKIRKCNIFKVPHHCGLGTYNNMFMNAAYPEIALSSLGDGYTFNCAEVNRKVFIDNANGFQKWFEDHEVPNYIVGVMMNDIDMEIRPDGYRFISNVRRCIRTDEGLT